MSKSIYDEVLENINKFFESIPKEIISTELFVRFPLTSLKKALEQAKNQEKLLELYKELARLRELLYDRHIQKEPFLYIYQDEIEELESQIKELEKW